MSKSSAKSNPRRAAARHYAAQRSADRAVYITIIMVGAFGLGLWFIMDDSWPWAIVGFVVALAVLVNLATWRVIKGVKIAGWQQSLARIPLRFAGFGTRGGKPLEAAKHHESAFKALFISIAVSVVLFAIAWLIADRLSY